MSKDAETQPLLPTTEGDLVNVPRPGVSSSKPPHFCARCSSELDFHSGKRVPKCGNARLILIIAAIVLSVTIFALAVAEMSTARRFRSPSILQIFVALWTDVTITMLIILVYMGRRREGRSKLGRTTVQIRVLCALACSWIVFMIAMMTQNARACDRWSHSRLTCGLFTTIHVLSWWLIIILFSAAYATYCRAVRIHGSTVVAVPVAAWRFSDIADGEGSITI
ncbi:hypothetical protein DFH07DRAFT_396383 [Mycena maculata]|uniref:Uncharacterized protein n=1 Tax=Mycena maculata TaxID=230809 RepID=A0AAD7JF73_9AGAR|nr:hypothetical protein DFH07DRAFT_396383 [Mycena maculata]